MRTIEFFVRMGLLLPLAHLTLILILTVIALIAKLLGATSWLFSSNYSTIGILLGIIVTIAVIYCQAKACWRK